MQNICRELTDGTRCVYAWWLDMHTRIDILLHAPGEEAKLIAAAERIKSLVSKLEQIGNKFDSKSELYSLNHAPSRPVRVSAMLYDMVSRCIELNRLTEGLFDVTVGSSDFTPGTPTPISLCASDSTIDFGGRQTSIDLSGFIKGYALDRIRLLLRDGGVPDALVSLGNSSVMTMGRVTSPVTEACLTTSGNDTPSRSHIINPLTGERIKGKRAISVVTAGGAEGEALAKALFIASPECAPALLQKFSATLKI